MGGWQGPAAGDARGDVHARRELLGVDLMQTARPGVTAPSALPCAKAWGTAAAAASALLPGPCRGGESLGGSRSNPPPPGQTHYWGQRREELPAPLPSAC